jgi:hypothetical protein
MQPHTPTHPQPAIKAPGLTVKTNIKAGAYPPGPYITKLFPPGPS